MARYARCSRSLAFRAPMARRVGEGKARRVAGTTPASLSSGQDALSTNRRNPPAHLEGKARKARHRGGLSLGYFSLATHREVTRPPAGGRKPAAGEPGRGHASKERIRKTARIQRDHAQRDTDHLKVAKTQIAVYSKTTKFPRKSISKAKKQNSKCMPNDPRECKQSSAKMQSTNGSP